MDIWKSLRPFDHPVLSAQTLNGPLTCDNKPDIIINVAGFIGQTMPQAQGVFIAVERPVHLAGCDRTDESWT